MPVKDLTTNHQFGSGFVRLAVIHKGAKRTAQDLAKNKPGSDLDYLRIEFDEGFEHLHRIWESIYGDKPKMLTNVRMAAATADHAFPNWYEEWGQAGLKHRCDGETQVKWFNPDEGKCSFEPRACDKPNGCKCQLNGRLSIVMPNFVAVTGAMGIIQVQTHSRRDIDHIYKVISDTAIMCAAANVRLFDVPFTILREPEEFEITYTDKDTGKPKRGKTTKSMIHIRPDEAFVRDHLTRRVFGFGTGVDMETGALLPAGTVMGHALPATTSKPWTEDEAKKWARHHMSANDLSLRNLLDALGVSALSEWKKSAGEAEKALDAWLEVALSPADQNGVVDGEYTETN